MKKLILLLAYFGLIGLILFSSVPIGFILGIIKMPEWVWLLLVCIYTLCAGCIANKIFDRIIVLMPTYKHQSDSRFQNKP